MKKWIHPTYNQEVQVVCICWNQFKLSAAVAWPIKVETCPACHPVYTGKIETKVIKGRMEKYLEKKAKITSMKK